MDGDESGHVTHKIIFSPQLANYLITHGFEVAELKRKRGAENEAVFVFLVTDGFYDAINNWKAQKPKIKDSYTN